MRTYNYLLVLFNGSTKQRVLYRSNIKSTIDKKYSELLKKSIKFFPRTNLNKKKCDFELILLKNGDDKNKLTHVKDSLGRNVPYKITGGNYVILEVSPFEVEELIYDHQTSKRIAALSLIDDYLPKEENNLLNVFTINNKLVIRNDDEIKIFSLKNIKDCRRVLDNIRRKFTDEGRVNCIFTKDLSTAQRKEIYNLLESKGFNRSFLYKHYTY